MYPSADILLVKGQLQQILCSPICQSLIYHKCDSQFMNDVSFKELASFYSETPPWQVVQFKSSHFLYYKSVQTPAKNKNSQPHFFLLVELVNKTRQFDSQMYFSVFSFLSVFIFTPVSGIDMQKTNLDCKISMPTWEISHPTAFTW